jgi:hypothetical protein
MSVNAVSNQPKTYDAGTNAIPPAQSQAEAGSPEATRKATEEERSARSSESKFAGSVMRAKLDGEIDSVYQKEVLTPGDPKKPLRNAAEANAKLEQIATSDPAAYRAITDNIATLDDNKKQALIQVITDPNATPQSMRVAAESLGGLPESAKVHSNGQKYTGVVFGGDQPTIDHLKKLKEEGKINQSEFDVFAAISKNEGNLNAINTYDSEAVSYGLRQNNGGALHPMLKAVKDQSPEKFKQHFEDKGLSIREENGRRLLQYESPASGNKFTLPDEKAKIPLEDRLHLANVFHQAGKDPEVNAILNQAQHPSARASLNHAMNTPVAGGKVSDFVGTSRGKAYINDAFNHLPKNAQDQFKQAALDIYSRHGFDVNDPKKLSKDQLVDKVAHEFYQKEHPGQQMPSDQAKEYRGNKARGFLEEEYIQRTKQLRMEHFKEKAPERLAEMERRYNNIEQYFRSRSAA